jgi:hypothetical protein
MIGSIRKHSAVLWWIIVIAVIVSFVVWFAPNQPSLTSLSKGAGEFGSLYGRGIKPDEARAAFRQARLYIETRGGRGFGEEAERRVAYQFLLFDDQLQRLQIKPGPVQVAAFVKERMPESQSGVSAYDQTVEFLKAKGFTEAEYIEVLRREVGQRQLAELMEIPSQLLPPREAEAEYRREHELAVASAVFFSSSNFLGSVQITPAGLGQFFTNRMVNYRGPEKYSVTFVKFASSNHLARAEQDLTKLTDLSARLEGAYTQRGAESFLDNTGKVLAKDAALARLKEELLRNTAVSYAAEQANNFYNDLGQIEPIQADNLATLAAKQGLKVEAPQPFSALEQPPGMEMVRNLAQALNQVDPTAPFTEPLVASDGVYLVALRQRIPAATPNLDSIRARVTEDYRRSLAQDAARSAGQAFRSVATNALAAGKTFAGLVSEQKLIPVDLPPFSLAETTLPGLPAQADLSSLKDTAFALQPNQLSNFILSRDGGYVLFLKERRPAAEAAMKAEMPSYLAGLRQREQGRSFSDWLENEFRVSGLKEILEPKPTTVGNQPPATR